MTTPLKIDPTQLRLAADIIEKGLEWEWKTSINTWMPSTNYDIRDALRHRYEIRRKPSPPLSHITPGDGRELHNKHNLTPEQVQSLYPTHEAINVKIAELSGFVRESWPGGIFWYNPDHPLCDEGKVIHDAEDLPNYCGDLNAMHEAEEKMQEAFFDSYMINLGYLAITRGSVKLVDAKIWHSSAHQRATAYLMTML